MRRILLLAAMLTVALPSAAQASVIPTVAADTLTVTGDGAADSITLRLASPTSLEVNGAAFDRSPSRRSRSAQAAATTPSASPTR